MWRNALPGLLWLENYNRDTFKHDVFSGLTIAVMLIPQGMAYAIVAGLPPEYGLYACIFPPIMYALLGTSNKISIGPVALDSILILNGLSLLADPGSDNYLQLAVTLTLMVGVIQIGFGVIRFGFIANFLSYPVIVGYTSAAALIIIGSQMENMLGIPLETGSIFYLVTQISEQVEQWHWLTIAVGLIGLAFMRISKKITIQLPFALILLIIGMLISGIFDAQHYGIDVVAYIPQGIPSLAMPDLSLNTLSNLLPTALTVALMGYAGSMSICKSQEKPTDKILTRPNQELYAIGFANIVGAMIKAFPVSASFSRSAAFREAGAKTQLSAIISAAFILLTLLFLTPVFASFPLPKALLSCIIIVSVSSLFQLSQMKELYRQRKREFSIMMATFIGTLILGVQTGLLVGITLSIGMVIYNTAKPHMTELGAIQDGRLFRNINRFNSAQVRQDALIFRFDAPLYFANKDYFVEKVYAWIKRRDPEQLKYVIFNAESVNSMDSTGINTLHQVIQNCEGSGLKFIITNAIGPVRDALNNSSLQSYLSPTTMFSTVHDAIMFIDSGVNQHAQEALQSNKGTRKT